MAVTWLYLPLTFSRLGLRNWRMGDWAHTLKVFKVFTKVGWGPWLKGTLPWTHWCNKLQRHYSSCPEWVCFLERLARTFGVLVRKLLTLSRQVPLGATLKACSSVFYSGEGAPPFWKESVLQCLDLSRWWIVDGSRGTECSGKEVSSQQDGRGGLINPPFPCPGRE